MTVRIGIFLGSEPSGGGLFQYSQAILEAAASLPQDRFLPVAAYLSPRWSGLLRELGLSSIHVPRGFWGRFVGAGWMTLGLSQGIWRKAAPWFHPQVRALLRQRCSLWIFPAQDSLSFQVPVPALVSIADLMHRYERRFPEVGNRLEYHLREANFRNICRWSSGIIVDSRTGREQVAESYRVPTDRIFVLPYVPPGTLNRGETGEADFDARYSLPSRFLFYPAQFWFHKNHANLLRAVALAKKEAPDIQLVLVGFPKNAYSQVIRLRKKLELESAVRILGYVPAEDIPAFYRRARALVMPTFFGPTNIPPLEAFSMRCPVAVSRVYGIPEQVGEAALLFNPESPDEIAACILRLWRDDNLCDSLKKRGAERAAMWGQREFNSRLLEIIEQVVSR